MSSTDPVNQIDEAFARGDNSRGLTLLRQHVEANPEDGAAWHRLANIEEQIGDWQRAGKAHYHCIEAAPGNPLGYLYAGHWLYKNSDHEAAAAAFSLAQDADPACLQLWRAAETVAPTALRSRLANSHLRRFLSDQHRALFDDAGTDSRVARASWIRTSDRPPNIAGEQLAPELFFIPDLEQKPWFERDDFEWTALLESGADKISDELDAALQNPPEALGIRPYLAENTLLTGKIAALAGSTDWTAIDLYRDGELNEPAAALFPDTLAIIEKLPTYGLDKRPFEVFFSMLQGGRSIDDHYGLSNHSLTCHLGLQIPGDGFIEVAGERREWRRGELLAFDDSYLHSAHNQSREQRIVLIFSIWHPSLSRQETVDVQHAFATRRDWMSARREKLGRLLAGDSSSAP